MGMGEEIVFFFFWGGRGGRIWEIWGVHTRLGGAIARALTSVGGNSVAFRRVGNIPSITWGCLLTVIWWQLGVAGGWFKLGGLLAGWVLGGFGVDFGEVRASFGGLGQRSKTDPKRDQHSLNTPESKPKATATPAAQISSKPTQTHSKSTLNPHNISPDVSLHVA